MIAVDTKRNPDREQAEPQRNYLARLTSGLHYLSQPAVLLGMFFAAGYSFISIFRYRRMLAGVDLALFTEAVQNYALWQPPNSRMKAVADFNLLGDHFTPAVAILAPIYRLVPHSWVLVILQAALIGLSVGIVYLATQQLIGWQAGITLSIAYGISWGIQSLAIFDFHEVALALPLLAMGYAKLIRGQYAAVFGWSAPLMLVKEDSVFLLLGISVVLFVMRAWKWSAVTVIFGGLSETLI